jgi:hypothetical protein
MKTIAAVCLVGYLVGAQSRLSAGILWDGLRDPTHLPNASINLEAGATIGLHVSPLIASGPVSLVGYVGMPFRPAILAMLPMVPTVTLSLWQEDGRLAAEATPLAGFGLLGPSFTTESRLRVWSVACDLANLGWVLHAGESYVIGVTIGSDSEWLVRDAGLYRSLVRRSGAWEELDSNQTWNVRLMATPIPEANGAIGVLLSLALFAVLRPGAMRRGSAAR